MPVAHQREPSSTSHPSLQVETDSVAQHYAAHMHESSGSAYLYCTMAHVFRDVGPDAYKAYLRQVLADAGDPTDPIERMLLEQITLAHHNVGRLHVKAAAAESLEEARIYLGSAALLTGEFRRTVATLKKYREPTGVPALRVEAAPATSADAVDESAAGFGAGPSSDVVRKPQLTELVSKPAPGAIDDDATILCLATEPQTGAGWETEPSKAAGADRRRSRKAARRGAS